MSTTDTGSTGKTGVKTLAIRLEPDLHAQLALIAQLRGSTITDEIRQAIETHVNSVKASPDLASKADGVLEDIERDAASRREAIATLFGDSQPAKESGPRARGRRSGEGTTGG